MLVVIVNGAVIYFVVSGQLSSHGHSHILQRVCENLQFCIFLFFIFQFLYPEMIKTGSHFLKYLSQLEGKSRSILIVTLFVASYKNPNLIS